MKVDVLDHTGKKIEELNLNYINEYKNLNDDIVFQSVRIYSGNLRQGTVKTKTKSQVRGGGAKPWKQKGTGRARAGSKRSPIWVGGGRAHGPKPREYNSKLNANMSVEALGYQLYKKIKNKNLSVLDINSIIDSKKSVLKTKNFNNIKKDLSLESGLLLVQSSNNGLYKATRNIKGVDVVDVNFLNSKDLMCNKYVLIEKSALSTIEKRLK